MNKKFLCLIIDSNFRNTIKEYEIEATDWIVAEHKARKMFSDLAHYAKKFRGLNWEVDVMELEATNDQ